jgi:carboxynorspermidine decarboxylase
MTDWHRYQQIRFDPADVPSPSYVVDETDIAANLAILQQVMDRTGARIILALKGFAMWRTFAQIREVLCGVTASAIDEAELGHEFFGKEVHICAPGYIDAEFDKMMGFVNHIVFNSLTQWQRYRERVHTHGGIECGLRINPEHREVDTAIYDPCGPCSRLGITRAQLDETQLDGIDGLHFHNLCELNADSLARTLPVVEAQFGHLFPKLKWINMGGGHHITRPDYDVDLLCDVLNAFRARYPHLTVYLEPGSTVALNTGVLVSTVLDIVTNGMQIAVLDTSAAAHMPDVIEMPYRPLVMGSGEAGEKPHTYRLAGMSCLAGDVIGDYSFDRPLRVGDRLVFCDMAHYTMVKNTTFNGIRLPTICLQKLDGSIEIVRKFGYEDYRNRLS